MPLSATTTMNRIELPTVDRWGGVQRLFTYPKISNSLISGTRLSAPLPALREKLMTTPLAITFT